MKKIYLFCSAGMSTSMLAKKMQEAADAHGLAAHVEAFSSSKVGELVERDHPDCILLGPQVGYMFDDINERYGKEAPVGVIDAGDYGGLNAERVLKYSILLMKQFAAK